jgi:hypothetical protein
VAFGSVLGTLTIFFLRASFLFGSGLAIVPFLDGDVVIRPKHIAYQGTL